MQPVQDLTIEDRVSRTQYQFTVEDANPDELSLWVPRLVERLRQEPALADVASDLQDDGLQAYVDIDRATASRLGITPAAIDNALYNAFGQRLVSTIFTQTNQYRVVLEVQPQFQLGPAALDNIYVPATIPGASGGRRVCYRCFDHDAASAVASSGASGTQQVRLSSIANVVERTAPLVVNHIGQFPAATISFNLAPGASLGDAVEAIEAAQQELGLPASAQIDFQGAALAFRAVALERAVADPRGHRHDVHRARRALRELHPPDHDPLDAAFRRRRRAARADDRRQRPRRSSRSSASSC